MDDKNKKKFIGPIVTSLFPMIIQGFIEAVVAFFTTVGLEAWWHRNDKKNLK